ncbi:alpha/beta hydrolase, partial [Acinetobacter baumannii]
PQAENIFSSIQVPLYIGVGRQDQWSTLEQHQKICELNSLAKLHTYECSGHMSPVEAAHQVNISLLKWLNTL